MCARPSVAVALEILPIKHTYRWLNSCVATPQPGWQVLNQTQPSALHTPPSIPHLEFWIPLPVSISIPRHMWACVPNGQTKNRRIHKPFDVARESAYEDPNFYTEINRNIWDIHDSQNALPWWISIRPLEKVKTRPANCCVECQRYARYPVAKISIIFRSHIRKHKMHRKKYCCVINSGIFCLYFLLLFKSINFMELSEFLFILCKGLMNRKANILDT